ncbi:MAG TPA: DUF3037 domain-containing protein [Actinocrinis sp.]|jgi:hypothetical protein
MSAEDLLAFDYALLRIVPRVEKGEAVNAGLLVYCRGLDFLGSETWVDRDAVLALDPEADLDDIAAAVRAYGRVCRGGLGAGAAGASPVGQRFRWLTAPRSTVVQPGPVHLGLTADPLAELRRLARRLSGRVRSAEAPDATSILRTGV